MKKMIACLFAVAALSTACKEEKKEEAKPVTPTSVTLPYQIGYSSDFEIGDSKYAQTVLTAWKDYDNNTMNNSLGIFADTVAMDMGEGSHLTLKKDSAVAFVSKVRGMFASAVSTIDAVVVLKPKGKDETWVCIWGKEVDAMKDGKKDSTSLNENWMFNKDGKVARILQYAAHGK